MARDHIVVGAPPCTPTATRAGRTVLVAAGAGAVGHFGIELAKAAGARVVTTVSGSEKAEPAKAPGTRSSRLSTRPELWLPSQPW
ncbi:hypothetical protein [Streptomyces sp. Vc74B-19]|uniref:hypothetical protein n=1 Tax=Streptomyces sp. Vc74B-19 TaxID=2741324 RepID=UPI0035B1E70F